MTSFGLHFTWSYVRGSTVYLFLQKNVEQFPRTKSNIPNFCHVYYSLLSFHSFLKLFFMFRGDQGNRVCKFVRSENHTEKKMAARGIRTHTRPHRQFKARQIIHCAIGTTWEDISNLFQAFRNTAKPFITVARPYTSFNHTPWAVFKNDWATKQANK